MRESALYNQIIRAAYPFMFITRANVGAVISKDGRRFSSGLPKGFPDLFGVLPACMAADGREHTVFIECKVGDGKLSPEQRDFLNRRYKDGCICGVCRSVDDFWGMMIPHLKAKDDNGET